MGTRKTIVFKLNNEVVCEEPKDLTIDEIYAYKDCIARELGCEPFEIEVDLDVSNIEETELDSTVDGLVFWKALFFRPIVGIRSSLVLGSDEHLDAILDGTLENYLEFFTEKLV
jgi:hypothetical protein